MSPLQDDVNDTSQTRVEETKQTIEIVNKEPQDGIDHRMQALELGTETTARDCKIDDFELMEKYKELT